MKNKENEKYVKLGVTLVCVIVAGLLISAVLSSSPAILSFLNKVMKILRPFLYGAVIAYLLTPLCNRLERLFGKVFPKKKGLVSALSIVLSLVIALLVIFVILMLVIPNVVKSILQIINAMPSQLEAFTAWLHELLEAQPELQDQFDSLSANVVTTVESWLKTDLLSTVTVLANSVSGQVVGLVNLMYNLFIGVLISVYLLAGRKKFAVQARLLVGGVFPKKWAEMIEDEVHYADRMFNGFLMGRILDSLIICIICFAFSSICGFESAVLVSVIVGVTNVIPVFGPYLGAIPCALILLMENPMHCIIFIIFIIVLQLVDGNLIGPRILGQTTGVSSFWVLFAVLLFGGLWGLVGMIVGVPLFAVIYDIIKKLVYLGLGKHGRDDLVRNGSGGTGAGEK